MSPHDIIPGVIDIACGLVMYSSCSWLDRNPKALNGRGGCSWQHFARSEENRRRINRFAFRGIMKWSLVIMAIGVISFFLHVSGNIILIMSVLCAPILVLIPSFTSLVFALKVRKEESAEPSLSPRDASTKSP